MVQWTALGEGRTDPAAFLALARRGHEIAPFKPPTGPARLEAERAYQQAELARSITFCRATPGLGIR